ncbi:hypothetical protein [Nocardia asiatica]|uniref:hypothetical protein n=1 Tax=Nocardia asiatica TaxID=209252 RepID=UPI003EE3BB6F
MIDPDLDPAVETQLRTFLASAADLSTATIQLDKASLNDIVQPIQVEEKFMACWPRQRTPRRSCASTPPRSSPDTARGRKSNGIWRLACRPRWWR